MNEIQKIVKHLDDRDKRNHIGCKLLISNENYIEKKERIIAEAIAIIQGEFIKSHITQSGIAKLTATSTYIGEAAAALLGIYDHATKEGTTWREHIRIGDLILEAIFAKGFIEITYTHFDLEEMHRCYIIKPIPGEWEKLGKALGDILPLVGTQEEPIGEPTFRLPLTQRPMIKSIHSEKTFNNLKTKPFMKSAKKLSNTGWKINTKVLQQLYRYRKSIKNSFKVFEADCDNSRRYLESDSEESKKFMIHAIFKRVKKMRKMDQFYQYVDLDYRGRIYYTEPFMNFQSVDFAKGLMLFKNGSKLDQTGLWWLAVHTATSFNKSYHIDKIPSWLEGDYKNYLESEGLDSISVDKMTLEDRVRWTNNNMDLIIECAKRNILCYNSAEKPVTFLACCYEWQAIDKDPNHICHLPVSVDGSNNGWQHLGAISKDVRTGELVGLIPVEIQRDFYVQTAKELIKLMPDWFAKRKMPMKSIRKGISKRGSMTRAYSAGADKIAENMYKDCHQAGYTDKYNISLEDCRLLAKNLISAINTVCPGPLQTMKFLQKIANKKLETDNQIFWWTPSGFPVRYQTFLMNKMKTKSTLKGLGKTRDQVKHTHMVIKYGFHDKKPVADKARYASGISPNFIHSMDASHMALVIHDWEYDFGAVHDSFSAHPNHIENLLDLTKSVFINMYNDDNYFNKIERILKVTMPEQPALGNLNIQEVYNSDYFFA